MKDLSFKNWFEETMGNKVTRISVYDFDGTIANVPERPSKWFGKDWWGHEDSLSDPHYDGGVNKEVVDAMRQDQYDPDTRVILLTGRRGVIAHKVRDVLRNQGLYGRRVIPDSNKEAMKRFKSHLSGGSDIDHPEVGHEQHFSGDHSTEEDYPKTRKGKPDGSTLAHKMYVINKAMNPDIRILEFWEDRADHIPHFIKLGLDLLHKFGIENGGRLERVILHRVFPPVLPGGQGTVQHIPIKKGMNY
ncbi:MAG: hypothetical protein DWQ19_12685 [Crenarchaeota archaeon]|nr:MAG: hypothetical protein DWQ19_12685 [Thermoproteota archaeon]